MQPSGPGEAFRSGRPSPRRGSTSACSPRAPPWWNCCCSMAWRRPSRPASSASIPGGIARTTTGTSSCPGLTAGQLYGYRVQRAMRPRPRPPVRPGQGAPGPLRAGRGRAPHYSRRAAQQPGDNTAVAMKSAVADPQAYDWQGDAPLQRPFAHTVIYELHVAGFTRHPSSGVAPATRGTYAGLIEKIPYLTDLGVTAVELLPVFQFDAQDAPPGLVNYWGYSPVSFFAPTRGTARARTRWAPWTSSATWSRRSIAPGSRSSWTWCTTTPPRGITRGRRCAIGAWPTTCTTSWSPTGRAMPTTPAPATR